MPLPQPYRIVGAQVLTPAGLVSQSLVVPGARIGAPDVAARRTVDLTGYRVMPGIVDLWSEGPGDAAAAAAAAAGVTTRVQVQGWSWEGGLLGPDAAEAQMAARHARAADDPPCDTRLALRVETHTTGTTDRLAAALRRHGADLVLFGDRLPESLERLRADLSPGAAAAWVRAEAALEGAGGVPRHLCRLAEVMDTLGIPYGSVGDRDAGMREYYRLIGAGLCVAPVRAAPARAAVAAGDAVLVRAADVLSGGGAADVALSGQAAGLVSGPDPAEGLVRAALRIAGFAGLLPAWALVSGGPARVLSLTDRGALVPGLRADLCILDPATGRVAGTIAGGRLVHADPGLRARFAVSGGDTPIAAE